MSEIPEGRALLEFALHALARTPGILQAHVRGQPRQVLDRRPAEHAWSKSEILAHLADFEVHCFQPRVDAILRGDPVSSVDPDQRALELSYATQNPFESLDRLTGARLRSLARLRQISPEQLSYRAIHGELGEVTLGNLLAEWVVHDLSHIRQLLLVTAQLFLPATGPWRATYRHLDLPPAP